MRIRCRVSTPIGELVLLGTTAGLSEIRLASFMPYAGVWVGYEWLPAEDTRGAEHVLRAGTKFGIDWDFSR